MALTRAKKAQKVEQLAGELEGSTSAIIGTFSKLSVAQDFELRQKVREAGGRYRVVKNKLAARASEGTGIEAALQGLKGVSSVAYTSGDPVALAKALSAWVKDNAEWTFKLGIVDGKVINVEEVQALATMPAKEEIFAKLLFLINAPAQRLATVLAATGRDLAVVLNQGVEKEKCRASGSQSGSPAGSALGTESAPASASPVPAAAATPGPAAAEAVPAEDLSPAPAPAEGPAAEGGDAVEATKQAEAAVSESPAEG